MREKHDVYPAKEKAVGGEEVLGFDHDERRKGCAGKHHFIFLCKGEEECMA